MARKHRTGYIFKRGKNFSVQWRINGKVFTKALYDDAGNPISNRRDAEVAKAKVLAPFVVADEAAALESIAAKLEGRKGELARLKTESNPPLAIKDAWAEFLKSPNRPDSGPSTLRQYQFQFAGFAKWMAEKHPEFATLRDVTKEIAEKYASHLITTGLSSNTYNKHLNLLTLVFRVLKSKGRLTDNPWSEFQRKRLTTQSRRELTFDELKRVCCAAEGEIQTLLALGVYSGLRLGDCATLRWGEVDLLRGIICRVPNKTARRHPEPVKVPIHGVLRDLLSTIPKEGRGEYVLPKLAGMYLQRVDLVTDMVQAHFEKCGITLHKPGTGENGKRAVVEIGFHSLRHSFVSMCRGSDVPMAVVQSLVGHSNPAMTRHYTHVGDMAASRAVATLPSVMVEVAVGGALRPEAAENLLDRVREIVHAMSGKNWKIKQNELLAILPVKPSEICGRSDQDISPAGGVREVSAS